MFFQADFAFEMSLFIQGEAKTTNGLQAINNSTETLLWDTFDTARLWSPSALPVNTLRSIQLFIPCNLICYFAEKTQIDSALGRFFFLWESETLSVKCEWIVLNRIEKCWFSEQIFKGDLSQIIWALKKHWNWHLISTWNC